MNKIQIAQAYIERMGMIPVSGEGFEPVMPYIMMDSVYQIYKEEIQPLPLKNQLKQYRNKWEKNYKYFNHEFFSVFTQDEAVDITDMMDEFEEFIANDLMVVRSTVMNIFGDDEFEMKKTIGACSLCNIITQSAQILWSMVYRDFKGRATKNPYLSAIEKSTHDFMNAYYVCDKVIDLNASKTLKNSVDSLCYKMMHYLDI